MERKLKYTKQTVFRNGVGWFYPFCGVITDFRNRQSGKLPRSRLRGKKNIHTLRQALAPVTNSIRQQNGIMVYTTTAAEANSNNDNNNKKALALSKTGRKRSFTITTG